MGMTADDWDGPFIEPDPKDPPCETGAARKSDSPRVPQAMDEADHEQSQIEHDVEAPRDADGASDEPWRDAPFPRGVDGREKKYQVVIRRAVLNDIRAHGCASPAVEVCGVILGNVYRDGQGPWCYVEANIRGNYASGRNAQVTFTSETWTHIHEQMDKRFPNLRIVGWYHTHPGFGIFLSEMDVFIQRNFFAEPWQLAFVDDPKGGDRGVFVWRAGTPRREPYLVKEDVPEQSPRAGVAKARGWLRRWAGLTMALAVGCAPTAFALIWWWRN